MSKTNVRVELRELPPHAAYYERDTAFKNMLKAFKKAVGEAGIKDAIRENSAYEKPGDKKRRKQRQNKVNQLKSLLKENFPNRHEEGGKKSDKKVKQ